MRISRLLISCGLVAASLMSGGCAAPAPYPVPVGYREFEMFGADSVYPSHYPMFGSIHAYQVLLEVKLTSSDGRDPRQLYLADKLAHPAHRYSLSPETSTGDPAYWVLPEVAQVGQSFRANIHIEREATNPTYIARAVTVDITRVIHFRLFHPDDKKPGAMTYLLFGSGTEAFLAHYIGMYPDFDQIRAVTLDPSDPPLTGREAASLWAIEGRGDDKKSRLDKDNEAVTGLRQDAPGSSRRAFVVGPQVHLEADLEIQR